MGAVQWKDVSLNTSDVRITKGCSEVDNAVKIHPPPPPHPDLPLFFANFKTWPSTCKDPITHEYLVCDGQFRKMQQPISDLFLRPSVNSAFLFFVKYDFNF